VHLYVYYKVTQDRAASALERVQSLQAELNVPNARILKRDEQGGQVATWMEIYEDVSSDFEERLALAVARHACASLTGPRHVERFADFD
jgi:hypothetical protein